MTQKQNQTPISATIHKTGKWPIYIGRRTGLTENAEKLLISVLKAGSFPHYMAFSSLDSVCYHNLELSFLLGIEGEITLALFMAQLHADRVQKLSDDVQRLCAQKENFSCEVKSLNGKLLKLLGRVVEANDFLPDFFVLWIEDITAIIAHNEKQALQFEELQKKNASLQAMFDAMPQPLWLRKSQDLSLKWCNHSYAQIVDADEKKIIAEQLEIAASVVDRSGRSLAEKAKNTKVSVQEERHIVAGGTRRLFQMSESLLQGHDLILGFANDMTLVEELRAELERHLEAQAELLEHLHTAVAVYGSDTRLVFFNSAFCDLWGMDEKWLSTFPTHAEVLELLRERRQLPEEVDFRRFKKERTDMFTSLIEPYQELMYRPDGKAIRLLVVPHPMGGLMFTYEDVTSRLALESSYNTLMAVQRETLDNLKEGIAVYGGDGRLHLFNPAFQEIWGLNRKDLDGNPHIADLAEKLQHHVGDGQKAEALRDSIVQNALDTVAKSGHLEMADGRVLEYQSVLLPDGAVLNCFTDISDSVRVEQALREKNAALEAADRIKLEFLANISYQLRTPLNAILGFGEMLEQNYFGTLNPRQSQYVHGILDAGSKLMELIDALLDLSTIEAGYMELEISEWDLAQAMTELYELTRDWAGKQKIRLKLVCAEDIGYIKADRRRIKQVMLNLVSNAIKFTAPGGEVVLSAQKIDQQIALGVSDTGVGIDRQDQQKVFGAFEKVNNKNSSSGVGLGLALVKNFIELHKGKVVLDSQPEKGTSVQCLLPINTDF
ncbi:MAG: PAS domain-containing sensor histidine kinase [Alphaproteobacteria bacterium]